MATMTAVNGNGKYHQNGAATKPAPPKKPDLDQLQPHNVEAEECLLGSLLLDKSAYILIAGILAPKDFFIQKNARIFEVIESLALRDQPYDDLIVIFDELERRDWLADIGTNYVSNLLAQSMITIHVRHYANIIKRAAILRALINSAGQIAQLAYANEDKTIDDICAEAEMQVMSAINRNQSGQEYNRNMRQLMDLFYDDLESRKTEDPGIMTGIKDLDRLLDGLQKATFNILAGRPSMGKTSLALQIGIEAARAGKKVLLFSLDTDARQISHRLVSYLSEVDSTLIRKDEIKDHQWPAVTRATTEACKLPLRIIDLPPDQATPQAIKINALQHKADLLIIDYLQLMRMPSIEKSNRYLDVTEISLFLKGLARSLDIPLLVLSQLNRASENQGNNKRKPRLSDLRESGAIEQDADTVILLYREDPNDIETDTPHLVEVNLAKQKQGPTGVINLYYKKQCGKMESLELRHQAQ